MKALNNMALCAALASVMAACSSPVEHSSAAVSDEVTPSLVVMGGGDSVATPAGWRPKACVSEVPQGAHEDRNGLIHLANGTTRQLVKCVSPTGSNWRRDRSHNPFAPTNNGWVESASYSLTGNTYRSLTAGWRVPNAPTGSYSGVQVFYSFPGLVDSTYILQPVIQYGNNGEFGGSYWTMSSWRCDNGSNCTHSTPITVYPGDSLIGTVVASSCLNGVCTWTVTISNQTRSTTSTRSFIDNDDYYVAVGGAIEIYNLTSCSQYPVSGTFYSGIALHDRSSSQVTPSWGTTGQTYPDPSCNFSISSSATTVRLYHNFSALAATISGDTATSTYTANPTGGVAPYSYYWEWCAYECDGQDFAASGSNNLKKGGGTTDAVNPGWNDVGLTTASICWTMSLSTLRLTITDAESTQVTTTFPVPYLIHICQGSE